MKILNMLINNNKLNLLIARIVYIWKLKDKVKLLQ